MTQDEELVYKCKAEHKMGMPCKIALSAGEKKLSLVAASLPQPKKYPEIIFSRVSYGPEKDITVSSEPVKLHVLFEDVLRKRRACRPVASYECVESAADAEEVRCFLEGYSGLAHADFAGLIARLGAEEYNYLLIVPDKHYLAKNRFAVSVSGFICRSREYLQSISEPVFLIDHRDSATKIVRMLLSKHRIVELPPPPAKAVIIHSKTELNQRMLLLVERLSHICQLRRPRDVVVFAGGVSESLELIRILTDGRMPKRPVSPEVQQPNKFPRRIFHRRLATGNSLALQAWRWRCVLNFYASEPEYFLFDQQLLLRVGTGKYTGLNRNVIMLHDAAELELAKRLFRVGYVIDSGLTAHTGGTHTKVVPISRPQAHARAGIDGTVYRLYDADVFAGLSESRNDSDISFHCLAFLCARGPMAFRPCSSLLRLLRLDLVRKTAIRAGGLGIYEPTLLGQAVYELCVLREIKGKTTVLRHLEFFTLLIRSCWSNMFMTMMGKALHLFGITLPGTTAFMEAILRISAKYAPATIPEFATWKDCVASTLYYRLAVRHGKHYFAPADDILFRISSSDRPFRLVYTSASNGVIRSYIEIDGAVFKRSCSEHYFRANEPLFRTGGCLLPKQPVYCETESRDSSDEDSVSFEQILDTCPEALFGDSFED